MAFEIRLENWTAHPDTTIRVGDHVAVVVGSNGVGKTAIRDALEFAFLGTGRIRGIETKKELGQLSIRDGESDCAVTIKTSTRLIRRTMNSAGAQKVYTQVPGEDEHQIPLGEADEILNHGNSPDVVRAALEPTEWFRLDASRRAELLIDATSTGSHTADAVEAAILAELSPDGAAEALAIKRTAEIIEEGGFREGEAHAQQERRLAKRELADLGTTEPDPDFEGIDLSAHTIEQHRERLAELRGERDEILVSAGKGDASARELRGQAHEAHQHLLSLLGARFPEPDTDVEAEHVGASAGLIGARENVAAQQQVVAEAEAELAAAQERENPAEIEHPGQCPHLPTMKCNVKLATFRKAAAAGAGESPTAGELLELEQAVETAKKDLQIRTDTEEKWKADLELAALHLAEEQKRVQAVAAHHELIDAAEKRVAELDEMAEVAAAAEKDPGPDVAGRLAEIESHIEKGEKIVMAKTVYDEAVTRHAESAQKAASLTRKVAAWDAIAVALKPGAKVERHVAGSAITPFRSALKDFERLTGEIIIGPDMSIRVGPERRHPTQLSTSQRLALGIAIQHGFASMVGLPILCCDAIDLFDGAGRTEWVASALESRPKYQGGIMGLATSTVEKPGPPPAGCVTFHLVMDQGQTTVREI